MEEKAFQLIEQLAAKLGVASEFIFAALVRQAYVNAVSIAVMEAIFIALTVILFRNRNSKMLYEDQDLTIVGFLTAIIFPVLFVFAIIGIPIMITGFVNPEYWALKEVFELIK